MPADICAAYSGFTSANQQRALVLQLCQGNVLGVAPTAQGHAASKGDDLSWPLHDGDDSPVHCAADALDDKVFCGRDDVAEEDVFAVLSHFLCTHYYDVEHSRIVVRCLLGALRDSLSARWAYVAPCNGSLLVRCVARTVMSARLLESLFCSNHLLDYLALLDVAAALDPEGFVQQVSMDDGNASLFDATALHALLLVPGRLAQCFPELRLDHAEPIVRYVERIFTSLIRDMHVSLFLLAHATPSPIRILIENLHLMPRSAKGIRLSTIRGIVQVLVAASGDPERRKWLEDFSLSEGPYQLYFALNEWCMDGTGTNTGRPGRLSETAAPYSIPAVLMVAERAAAALEEQTSGAPHCAENNVPPVPSRAVSPLASSSFGSAPQLSDERDAIAYDLLCLLLALPDDATCAFQGGLYSYLKDTVNVTTFAGDARSSTRFTDRSLPSIDSEHASGVQLGFRLLVHACLTSWATRPALCFFLSRLVVVMVNLCGHVLVQQGLVSPEVCLILERLVHIAPSQTKQKAEQRKGDEEEERGGGGGEAATPPQPLPEDTEAKELNNEFLSYVSTTVTLFCRCCQNPTVLARQEEGTAALAKLVVSLVASKQDLVSCTAIKAIAFKTALPAAPQQQPNGGSSPTDAKPPLPRRSAPPLVPTPSATSLLYNTLVSADLVMSVASELMCNRTSVRRKEFLLRLLLDISVRCVHLQDAIVPLSTNLILLMRLAASDPRAHALLPLCSDILSGLAIGVYDKVSNVVCHSLLGMVCAMDPEDDPKGLVVTSWSLQTVARLIARERNAQQFIRDRRGDLLATLHTLCKHMQCTFAAMAVDAPLDDDDVVVPEPGDTPVKKPERVRREHTATPASPGISRREGDVSQALLAMAAFHRQRRDVGAPGLFDPASLQRYLMCCDVLILTMHVLSMTHCLQQAYVADDVFPVLVRCLGAGPMLSCRLYTSIVCRCLTGMSCFASPSVLSEMHHVGKTSMLAQPAPPDSNRVTLQDLTCGWIMDPIIGDQLFPACQQRVVRPQFIRCILELLLNATASPTVSGFELVVSVVEFIYHVFHHRMENLYALSMCGVWDVAVCQLVRISSANTKLRSLCVHVISSAMRLFGLHGLSSIPVSSHLLLCFDEERNELSSENVSRVFSSWEWLLHNCLPCRVPLSFLSLLFGSECSTRQQRLASLSPSGSGIAAIKREVHLSGGIDVVTNFEVWKFPVDTHTTVVLWVMLDMSPTHEGDIVLCSLHFDKNRVVVELSGDQSGNLFIAVHNRNMGELRTRRVLLGKLPALPNKQWTLLHFTVENFAAKSQASLRPKFTTKFAVGMQALHGNHQYFEASVLTPDVEIYQSLREKSLGSCTALTHMNIGGLHKHSGGSARGSTRPEEDWVSQRSLATPSVSLFGTDRGPGKRWDDDSASSYTYGSNGAAAAGSEAQAVRPQAPHQLFFASMAMFQGELSTFEALVLFALGPDALFSLDFLDKSTVINLYPILARLTTENLRLRIGAPLSLLAAMWLRRQEPHANESTIPTFSGYFPFEKVHKDRVVCALGTVQGDLAMWSRLEAGQPLPTSSASIDAMGLVVPSTPSSNAGSTLSPGTSFVPGVAVMTPADSFASPPGSTDHRHMSASHAPLQASSLHAQMAASSSNMVVAPTTTSEFISLPRAKPFVQVPLELNIEDTTWHGGTVWEDAPTFLYRPAVYSVPPFYSLFEGLGGLQTFLWMATLLEANAPAQILVFQCVCTWLSLHYDKPMSDVWSGGSSKYQDLTLLTGILHHRLEVTREIAQCITRCAGYPVLARIDLIPLLLDFSLWARDAHALNTITSYLCELQVSTNSFGKFNTGVLRYRRFGDRHEHHVLEELLLHLHMRFVGSTASAWDVSTIPGVQTLIALLCTDVVALTRLVSSAAWLATEEEAASLPWALCLLDAAITALTDRPAVMPAPNALPRSLIAHMTTILKSNNDAIRFRGLQCFLRLSEWSFETIAGGVSHYEARSIRHGPRRCMTYAELRLIMVRTVGNERWLQPEQLALVDASRLQHGGDALALAPLAVACPMLFLLIAAIPYVVEAQQLAIIGFMSDLFHAVPHMQRAMQAKVFHAPSGLDDPFTSLLLYALAETLERSDRSLEIGDGAAIRALVELLIDILTEHVAHPKHHHLLAGVMDTLNAVTFSILNVFVEEDDIGVRGPTPLFHCARRHILNVLCASLCAFETQIGHAFNPAFVDAALQLLDLVNDVTALLFVPSGIPTTGIDDGGAVCALREGSRSSSPTHRTLPLPPSSSQAAYFRRKNIAPTNLAVCDCYAALCQGATSDGPVMSFLAVSRANIELVPVYALQLSSKMHASILCGASPVTSNMDKHRISHKCSQLHQQQLKLASFLLTIENTRDGCDVQVDELQTLCLLHLYCIGASSYGLQPGGGAGATSGDKKKGSASAQQNKSASSSALSSQLKVPKTAKWNEASVVVQPDALLMTAVARYKEPTLALLRTSLKFLSYVSDGANRADALAVRRADAALNICRVVLNHHKPVQFRKELNDECATQLEQIANGFTTVASCFADPRALVTLEKLPSYILTPHGQSTMQGHTTGLIAHAVARARQNLRVNSSLIPLLDPQRAMEARSRIDGGLQKLQAATMKRITFYEKTVEQDARVILAVNAAYRFSMLPWWGVLSTLHTDQPVALNRFELDRFMGPDWERSRLRRFAHEPKMLASEGNAIRFFQPLRSVVQRFAHEDEAYEDEDDMELLASFGLSAVPQSVYQRVLMQSESASHRCLLILPMDRVPVVLTVSHIGLLICVEVTAVARRQDTEDGGKQAQAQAQAQAPPEAKKEDASISAGVSSVATRSPRQRTLAHNQLLSARRRQMSTSLRYRHEVHDRVVPMSCIRAVWPRRNLLQHVALELLLDSGESIFLSFSSPNERKAIMEKIGRYSKQYIDKTLILSQNNLDVWRSWWCDGRISNFKYLMYLNFSGGRSYGDMRQYPIFPHVVGDYVSDRLEMRQPTTFRQLDKPMGAQTSEKEERAVLLYENLLEGCADDGLGGAEGGGGPAASAMVWHYGSHYAPLGCVLQFLVRVQPFGDYFLDMNAKLDHADRVFESMANTYANYTGALSKDVKEMVPEFYCLPELFVNTNEVPFGTKQDGSVVDGVQLPPWTSNPRSFVVTLREALECQYVSERLHHWIDLVFGHKQRGRDAVAAVNLFHPLTYEGTVDLAAVEDAVQYKSHVTQIDNFGQTPVQLFQRSAHKARCKANHDFYPTPCPTLRYDHAFAKSSALLFPERLQPSSSSTAGGGGGAHGGGGSVPSWITFCRSPIANAALGADELGDFFLSTSVTSRSVYHVLPRHVLPFTVVADVPKDFIVVRSHTVSLVDAKDLGKDLTSTRITKSLTTVATVQPPFAFVGTACGSILVAEVRFDDVVDVEVPNPPPRQQTVVHHAPSSGAADRPSIVVSAPSTAANLAQHGDGGSTAVRWLPDAREEPNVNLFSTSFETKASKGKVPQIKLVDCLFGHHGSVVALTVAPEWGLLVSAGQDWVLALWDLHRRLLIRTIPFASLKPARPLSLFHQRIQQPWDFVPQLVSVNPLRGDVVVAGLQQCQARAEGYQPQVRVFTLNGDVTASVPWKTMPTALLALGPVIFVAEGRTIIVLDSVTLLRRCELHHPALEDTIGSIAVNPYGTCVAAVDKSGNAGSWKVGQ